MIVLHERKTSRRCEPAGCLDGNRGNARCWPPCGQGAGVSRETSCRDSDPCLDSLCCFKRATAAGDRQRSIFFASNLIASVHRLDDCRNTRPADAPGRFHVKQGCDAARARRPHAARRKAVLLAVVSRETNPRDWSGVARYPALHSGCCSPVEREQDCPPDRRLSIGILRQHRPLHPLSSRQQRLRREPARRDPARAAT